MFNQLCPLLVAIALVGTTKAGSTPPIGPVIGILTQDCEDDCPPGKSTYIAASYVKYLESAGARVVPVDYKLPFDNMTETFQKLNGLLYPGGGMDLHDPTTVYMKAVLHLWDMAKQANDAGDFFPIWGTCLGFETICVAAANDVSVLENGFDSENLAIPLQFTDAINSSQLFGLSTSVDVMLSAGKDNVTMNNHESGVTPTMFANNKNLASFYKILSTNVDRKGRAFVSTIEGVKYPVFGTQWHPEKNTFEWTDREGIPHTQGAVDVAQYTANFFVTQTRKSNHVYPFAELVNDVIWNYNPVYTYIQGSNFIQKYFF